MLGVLPLLQGCFTGIESTKMITEKDVKRALEEMDRGKKHVGISPFADSLPAWRDGKPFWVVDSRHGSSLPLVPTTTSTVSHLKGSNSTITAMSPGVKSTIAKW